MKSIPYWLALAALLAGVALYVKGRDVQGLYTEYWRGQERVENLRGEVQSLEAQQKALDERIDHIVSDPVELEAVIRQNKDLVRQGETVYRIELEPK